MPCEFNSILAATVGAETRRWLRSGVVATRAVVTLGLIICGSSIGSAARTDEDVAKLCDRAALEASRSKGVPLDVLQAVSRVETGRREKSGLQPWPWTVNMEGKGQWFATLDEARSYVFEHFKNGARSFDVGCFQINYRWHGDAFRSIDDMFDPVLNAQYAAAFLSKLYQEFGNWSDTAGAYHSRTPEYARKYTARFDRIRTGLSGNADLIQAVQPSINSADSPLSRDLIYVLSPKPLTRGGTVTLGSLVPMELLPSTGARPFISFE